jgi:hypothetical protein
MAREREGGGKGGLEGGRETGEGDGGERGRKRDETEGGGLGYRMMASAKGSHNADECRYCLGCGRGPRADSTETLPGL